VKIITVLSLWGDRFCKLPQLDIPTMNGNKKNKEPKLIILKVMLLF
jgi:hypothetical protein